MGREGSGKERGLIVLDPRFNTHPVRISFLLDYEIKNFNDLASRLSSAVFRVPHLGWPVVFRGIIPRKTGLGTLTLTRT